MSHRNARLTVHGRRLLVHRVSELGMPVAHVAKAMGISRQCAHRWVARHIAEGDAGLHDRSSRPHSTPTRTPDDVEARILAARVQHRRGQDWLANELGVPARTISRVLRRHDLPRLCTLDPLTGDIIRSSKQTAVRYERERPGEIIHMDVKKLGRIPDGGGWRAHGRAHGHRQSQHQRDPFVVRPYTVSRPRRAGRHRYTRRGARPVPRVPASERLIAARTNRPGVRSGRGSGRFVPAAMSAPHRRPSALRR